ncbi:MAG: hypothetical protein LC746_00840 [Acidobacteria bacterium]|nr:hypothetical protein [Acidobacteriota bacterium]
MLKKFLAAALFVSLLAPAAGVAASAQAPPAAPGQSADKDIKPASVMGEVTAVNVGAKGLAVTTAAGNTVLVMLDDKTQFKRAKPGSTTLADATDIALSDVSVGDKVYARGRVSADHKSVPAQLVAVLTKADIAKKQEHDKTEWQRRGIWGTVTSLNATTKEVTLSARTPEGTKPVVVDASGAKIDFRRYAPDSVKFADAKASSFADLRVGDQLRALGERSADGARFTPEEIVSGSFKTILGTVASVDAAAKQIVIKPSDKPKQTLTVVVTDNTNLRKLDPQAGQMLGFIALRAAGGGMPGGAGVLMNGGRPAGGAPPQGRPGGGQGGGFGGGMRAGGGFDLQEMVDRQPPATLADLKPGDVVIVSSTTGADPTRVSAITLLAGAEPVLAALQTQPRRGGAAGASDLGLPSGIDLGIGLP